MNQDYKRRILKAKLLNYTSAFVENLNKVHPSTKSKFRVEEEEFLLDDYLFTLIDDLNDIKKAYEANDDGETLDKLWNGSYNYNVGDD